jgi:hypothetical protein
MNNLNQADFECGDCATGCGCPDLLILFNATYVYPLPTTIPDLGPLRVGDNAVEGFDY